MKQKVFALIFTGMAMTLTGGYARAASSLKLAPNLSFTDDSRPNFPITGADLSDGIAPGHATVIFFGTSNCWNTAREAERLVKLYPQYRRRMDFVIVDLNHISAGQQPLVAQYYRGAIPTIAVIDSSGKAIYDEVGETANVRGDVTNLQKLLDSAPK
jgi:hypothetical protein